MSRCRHVSVMKAAGFAVRAACRAAGVSSSGYCEWKDKEVAGPDPAGIADHRRRHIVSMVWRG